MKLAMTSKGMYNRCMEDKRIKIRINENEVVAGTYNDSPKFILVSSSVASGSMGERERYLNRLRNLSCNVSLRYILLNGSVPVNHSLLP